MGLPISQIVAFFPLLLPIWEQRPLRETDLVPSDYPVVVHEQDVPRQREGLRHGNRELRGTIYRHLREMDLPASRQLLADSLGTESDPRLVGTILQQLALCADLPAVDATRLRARFRDADPDVRYWAIRLAGRSDSFPTAEIAEIAGSATESRLRLAAAQALADRGARLPLASLRPLWAHADPVVRTAALAAALRVGGAHGQPAGIPRQALEDAVPVRCALAAALSAAAPGEARELAPLLAKDTHASVRASLAQSLLLIPPDSVFGRILLALARDRDPEVRRAAAAALSLYPEPAARDALVLLLGDPRTLVRRQAEESLVAIHASLAVDQAVAERLSDRLPYARYHAYRLLGRLDRRPFAEAVANGLARETEAVNIAAAVFALGSFEARFAANAVNSHATHADAGVRAAVAEALGQLAVPATYPAIQALAFDPEEPVRQAAILAMGRIADGDAFNPTLLRVLKTVKEASMTSPNRAAAAWAVGRVRPVSPANLQRLVVQATTPVVPGEMGEMLYEPDYALASCLFALAQLARQDGSHLAHFQTVHRVHAKVYAKDESPVAGALVPPPRSAKRPARPSPSSRGPLPSPPPARPAPRPTISASTPPRPADALAFPTWHGIFPSSAPVAQLDRATAS